MERKSIGNSFLRELYPVLIWLISAVLALRPALLGQAVNRRADETRRLELSYVHSEPTLP